MNVAVNTVDHRSADSAQRALQGHLMAMHAPAMATSAHAVLSESRACVECAALIAARDAQAR